MKILKVIEESYPTRQSSGRLTVAADFGASFENFMMQKDEIVTANWPERASISTSLSWKLFILLT